MYVSKAVWTYLELWQRLLAGWLRLIEILFLLGASWHEWLMRAKASVRTFENKGSKHCQKRQRMSSSINYARHSGLFSDKTLVNHFCMIIEWTVKCLLMTLSNHSQNQQSNHLSSKATQSFTVATHHVVEIFW